MVSIHSILISDTVLVLPSEPENDFTSPPEHVSEAKNVSFPNNGPEEDVFSPLLVILF
jgi:hypothetical protein